MSSSDLVTPGDIIAELARLRSESARGIDILAAAETKLAKAELEAERREAQALLSAVGTVDEKKAKAKLQSLEEWEAAALARVEVNRVKTKLKHLSESMMAVMHAGKMVEIQWKTAGIGER
jgi:hypothetical protein